MGEARHGRMTMRAGRDGAHHDGAHTMRPIGPLRWVRDWHEDVISGDDYDTIA